MNMKTLSVILMLSTSLTAFAEKTPEQLAQEAAAAQQAENEKKQFAALISDGTATTPQKCPMVMKMAKATPALVNDEASKEVMNECLVLQALSGGKQVGPGDKDNVKRSSDGKITCKQPNSYTRDYEECEKAVNYYTAVVTAEAAMNLEQQVRTDLKNQSIQKKAQAEMANGASQTSMFDAASASNKHQKGLQQEKMLAYSAAVAALVAAHRSIPSIDKIKEEYCPAKVPKDAQGSCEATVQRYKGGIASNGAAKDSLMAAIMEFTAKGVAAGIAMGQYGNAAKQIEAAKSTIQDEETDMMMEACVLNPTDPACSKTRNRVAGQSIAGGDFGAGDMGTNSSFNLGGESEVAPEMGDATNIEESTPIAGVNSPFVDDAKIAKGILDPAAAAQMQASGGAAGGGGGGGGGLGGGGASLGSDLNGANKDGDKEAQIKTNKVSGTYAQGSGGGYKGVGKGKDDANPFASLFDAKGSGGGVEEDRSIASGDIDGASSGLFQKISKRYSQIQADKRIEAKNLE